MPTQNKWRHIEVSHCHDNFHFNPTASCVFYDPCLCGFWLPLFSPQEMKVMNHNKPSLVRLKLENLSPQAHPVKNHSSDNYLSISRVQ